MSGDYIRIEMAACQVVGCVNRGEALNWIANTGTLGRPKVVVVVKLRFVDGFEGYSVICLSVGLVRRETSLQWYFCSWANLPFGKPIGDAARCRQLLLEPMPRTIHR